MQQLNGVRFFPRSTLSCRLQHLCLSAQQNELNTSRTCLCIGMSLPRIAVLQHTGWHTGFWVNGQYLLASPQCPVQRWRDDEASVWNCGSLRCLLQSCPQKPHSVESACHVRLGTLQCQVGCNLWQNSASHSQYACTAMSDE